MKLRQLLIVKLEFPIDDSGQKLSNVNAALEKLIVCPTQLPTIHVRNYALLLYYIRMEIKHISLKNMDAGYTFIVANYIYIYIYTHTREVRSNEVGTSQQRMRSNVAAAIGSVIKPDSTGKLQSFSGWTSANGSRKNKRDSIPLYRLFDPGCLFALHRSWMLLSHRSSNFDNEPFDEISFLI